jgi:glycosyltransferase involved in cell wall biosynthesis
MKIALFSFEYPPDTARGGIATYFHQMAGILSGRGHQVEVFAGGWGKTTTTREGGVTVHRLAPEGEVEHHVAYEGFHLLAGPYFAARHAEVGFDVIEGPELEAEAREAVRLVPDIPLVVKLHSPSMVLWRSDLLRAQTPPLFDRVRLRLEAKRLGMRTFWGKGGPGPPKIPEVMKAKDETERRHALEADEITAPSSAMARRMASEWGLAEDRIHHIPNPYNPSPEVLSIPIETRSQTVTFIGRLQVLKGVIELAQAVPLILRRHPRTKFRFVGGTSSFMLGDMRNYLENFLLRRHAKSVEFSGFVPLAEVPAVLASTDICVLPSFWESFSNVCAESMAAGRGVVGSSSGGMADLLGADGTSGRLVPPGDPRKIAAAVNELLADPAKRMSLGRAARERVLTEYNSTRIGALQEACYERAIARRRAAGKRTQA